MLRASESRSSAGADGGAGMTPEAAAPCGAVASHGSVSFPRAFGL